MKEVRKDIFKNAYFGKPYKTRDGRKAIYIQTFKTGEIRNELVVEDEKMVRLYYLYKDDGSFYHKESCFDIVSEWQEEINEEEFDKLAEDASYEAYQTDEYDNASRRQGYYRGYKAGYRKAIRLEGLI